jgi:hypothetical protein
VRFKDHRPKKKKRRRRRRRRRRRQSCQQIKRKDYKRKEKTGDFSTIKIYQMEATL